MSRADTGAARPSVFRTKKTIRSLPASVHPVHGKIEIETDLAEGTAVAVLAPDEAGFHLTTIEEDELASALAEIRSGDYVDGHELLVELRGQK